MVENAARFRLLFGLFVVQLKRFNSNMTTQVQPRKNRSTFACPMPRLHLALVFGGVGAFWLHSWQVRRVGGDNH